MTDWDGEGYERISGLQRDVARQTLSRVTLAGDEHCLDVGCGDGFISRLVAIAVPDGSVLGIDASPRMVQVAQSRPMPAGVTLSFQVGDVLDLRLDRQFDVVYSFNTLHWVVDQHAALTALAAATTGSGRVLVQYVCRGDRPSLESVAMQVAGRPRWAAAFDGFQAPFVHVDPGTYPQLAAGAGLAVHELTVHDDSWDFGSRAEFVNWCTVGFADWTARLAPGDVAAWVDDVVDAYQAVVGDAGIFRFMQLFCELRPLPR